MSQHRRALVVDDVYAIRYYLRTVLTHLGYDVDEVESVRQALASGPADYDLLVIDLNLGDGSGRDILAHLADRSPPSLSRCILMSGEQQDGKDLGVVVLRKPADVSTLMATVRHVEETAQLGKGAD